MKTVPRKMSYEKAELEVVRFSESDIITTSNMDGNGWTERGRLRTLIREYTESGALDEEEL